MSEIIEEISCIKDGITGICRDLKDKAARQLIKSLEDQISSIKTVINGLTGNVDGLVTKEEFNSLNTSVNALETALNNLDTTYATDQDIETLTTSINEIINAINETSRIMNQIDDMVPAVAFADYERLKSKNLLNPDLLGDHNNFDKTLETYGFWVLPVNVPSGVPITVSTGNATQITDVNAVYLCVNNKIDANTGTALWLNHSSNENLNAKSQTVNQNDGIIYLYFSANIDMISKLLTARDYIQVEIGEVATEYKEFNPIVHKDVTDNLQNQINTLDNIYATDEEVTILTNRFKGTVIYDKTENNFGYDGLKADPNTWVSLNAGFSSYDYVRVYALLNNMLCSSLIKIHYKDGNWNNISVVTGDVYENSPAISGITCNLGESAIRVKTAFIHYLTNNTTTVKENDESFKIVRIVGYK